MDTHVLACGISDYLNINKLPSEVLFDATSVAAFFKDKSKVGSAKVQQLLDDDATADNILAALSTIAKESKRESTVIIFFSGHGAQIVSGPKQGTYLLPVEVSFDSDENLAQTAIADEILTEALRQIDVRRLLVIFDCCNSGGIGQPKQVALNEIKVGLPTSYYESLALGRGRVILASSRENEVSMVYPGRDKNSLFTKHLLDGLNGKALCVDGTIRVLDLFQYVQKNVQSENPNQHPILKAELEDNFPIALATRNVNLTAPVANTAGISADHYDYDVFISYTHAADKHWVRKALYPSLKAEGVNVCLDDYNFRLGHAILDEMQRAVVTSRYTLGVFSPEYLDSEFAGLESTMAKHLGLENKEKRFIGIIHRECMPKLTDRVALMLDMTDSDEYERNIQRLVYAIKNRDI